MDVVFLRLLYPEEAGSAVKPTTTLNDRAAAIERAFSADLYSRNLRLSDLVVRAHLGRSRAAGSPGSGASAAFDRSIPKNLFTTFLTGLQAFASWTSRSSSRIMLCRFDHIDASVQLHMLPDGASKLFACTPVSASVFSIAEAPLDVSLHADLCIPFDATAAQTYRADKASHIVIRDRLTFVLDEWAYDADVITNAAGEKAYEMTLRLVDAADAQLRNVRPETIAASCLQRIGDVFQTNERLQLPLSVRCIHTAWY